MGAVGSSEHILYLTTRCKIPEETSTYSNTANRHLLTLNILYSSPNMFMFD